MSHYLKLLIGVITTPILSRMYLNSQIRVFASFNRDLVQFVEQNRHVFCQLKVKERYSLKHK